MNKLKKRIMGAATTIMVLLLAGCSGGENSKAPATTAASEKNGKETEDRAVAGDDVIELKWAQSFSATHIYTTEFAQRFIDEVAEKTDGRVKITLYPGEQLGKSSDYPTMLSTRMIDIANIDTGTSLAEFPLHGVWQLPNAYIDSVSSTPALIAMNRSGMLADELKKNGMVTLGSFTIPGYVLLYSGKEIYMPEDVKGMKFRVTGSSRIQAMTDLGATVVSLPSSEVSEALYKKTVDGAVNSANAAIQYGYHEMVDYVTAGISVGGLDAEFVISQAAWDGLPADIQEIFIEVGDECSLHVAQLLDDQLEKDLEGPLAEQCTVINVTDEEKAAWDAAVDPIIAKWVEEMNSKGNDGDGVLKARDEALAECKQ